MGYQVLSESELALLEAVDGAVVDGMPIEKALGAVDGSAPELVRCGVLRLLWSGRFTTTTPTAFGRQVIRAIRDLQGATAASEETTRQVAVDS